MKPRAAVLARVSTDEQTTENQLPACIELCERFGFAPQIFQETVSGATSSTERPEMQRILSLAHAGKLDAFVVWSLDRIGRLPWEIVDRYRELERLGVRIFSVREPWTYETGPLGFDIRPVLLVVMDWYSGLERARLIDRTKSGMARARRAGKPIGNVRRIGFDVCELAWNLRREGKSWAEVARTFGGKYKRTSIATAVSRWAEATGRAPKGATP